MSDWGAEMFATIALALALQIDSARKSTSAEFYAETSGWVILQSFKADSCGASADFESGSSVFIFWYPRRESMTISYDDKNMQSVEDGKEYRVTVSFIKGREIDEGWGERTATGSRTDDGVPQIFFSLKGTEALDDVASSDLVGIKYKERIVASLSLEGSAAMIAAMKRCSADILKNHPIDPFED